MRLSYAPSFEFIYKLTVVIHHCPQATACRQLTERPRLRIERKCFLVQSIRFSELACITFYRLAHLHHPTIIPCCKAHKGRVIGSHHSTRPSATITIKNASASFQRPSNQYVAHPNAAYHSAAPTINRGSISHPLSYSPMPCGMHLQDVGDKLTPIAHAMRMACPMHPTEV